MSLHIKWAGSKKWLTKHVDFNAVLGDESTYYELFAGGAHLYFDTKPKRAVLNDANVSLMSFYEIVRDDYEGLTAILEAYQIGCRTEKMYYQVRDSRPIKKLNQAARFYYLLKMCYNGLYRVNRAGDFNVGWGQRPEAKLIPPGLKEASEMLKGVQLSHEDFDESFLWEFMKPGDLVYLDPPYLPPEKKAGEKKRRVFSSYTADGFREAHHKILLDCIKEAVEKGVTVVLTLGECKFVEEYKKFLNFKIMKAPRNISCKVGSRTTVAEYLFYSDARILKKNAGSRKPSKPRKNNKRANRSLPASIIQST